MNAKEKKEFVTELCNSIAKTINNEIDAGKIPDEWNGIELRWLIQEKGNYVAFDNGEKKRKKNFKNTVIVNNL